MKRFARFELHDLIGHGAAGEVYDASDPSTGERVAIKILPPSLLEGPQGAERRTRFLVEAAALAALSHPGIVAVQGHGDADGVPYIVMERVAGRTLRELLRLHLRFTLPAVEKVMTGVLEPLAYLHDLGMVHRDLKPSNLILLPGWRVKIADFGLALIREPGRPPSSSASVAGTLGYMAPEQLMGHGLDPRTDLFACGVILYELLTGVRPFHGQNQGELIHRVLHHVPAPPSRHAPGLPVAWDELLARALAKKPGERFQSAPEMAAALTALCATLS